MEVGGGWGTDLPGARWHGRRFRSTARRRTTAISRWVWGRCADGELHARRWYWVDVAVAVAVATIRLLHVDGLWARNSTRCGCGALRSKKKFFVKIASSTKVKKTYFRWRLKTWNFTWRWNGLGFRNGKRAGTRWTRVGWCLVVSAQKQRNK